MPTIKCDICDNQFHRKPSHVGVSNFCSKECLDKHRVTKTTVKCSNCDKNMVRVKSAIMKHNFCNRECFGKWHSKNIQGENHPRFYLVHQECESCRKLFKPTSLGRKFCSTTCHNDQRRQTLELKCDNCGMLFERSKCHDRWSKTRNYSHCFCSKNCKHCFQKKEKHPKWIKDRGQIKNDNKSFRETPEMKKWRCNVFKRDDWTCQICEARSKKGQSVVLNAHHIKRIIDSPELALDVDNGITLCEKCHKTTYNKEELFEERFYEIANEAK